MMESLVINECQHEQYQEDPNIVLYRIEDKTLTDRLESAPFIGVKCKIGHFSLVTNLHKRKPLCGKPTRSYLSICSHCAV